MNGNDSQGPVQAGFLGSLDRRGLAQYLKAFEGELRPIGLTLQEESIGGEWFLRLGEALRAGLGAQLRCGLEEIAALSTRAGYAALLRAAAPRSVDLSAWRSSGRQNVSLWCYLRHRELFEEALGTVVGVRRRYFHEFWGVGRLQDAAPRDRALAAVGTVLERKFSVLKRDARCEVHSRKDGELDGSVLVVRHPRASYSRGSEASGPASSGPASTEADWRQASEDFVIYDRRMDSLSICARDAEDRELYRSAMGLVMVADPAHYGVWPVVLGDELLRSGWKALDASEMRGICSVRLRAVRIMETRGGRNFELGACRDAAEALEEIRYDKDLGDAHVMGWTMGVVLSSAPGTELQAECAYPNRLIVDPRIPLEWLREFLLARGLLVPPRRRSRIGQIP